MENSNINTITKVFNNKRTYSISAAYDSVNNKIIIAYCDFDNKKYGTAIVGTITNNDIVFGDPIIFNKNETKFISTVYDPIKNKVVIAYDNNGYGTAIVGTVSGTSISFGEPAIFSNVSTMDISMVYDPINNKVVFTYSAAYTACNGAAILGTIVGDTIDFGRSATFDINETYCKKVIYDSVNKKVIIIYKNYDHINHYCGKAVVGTVTGNTIKFNKPVIFSKTPINYLSAVYVNSLSAVYDEVNNKVIIFYSDDSNNYYGTAVVGTVVGTVVGATVYNTIVFGKPIVFNNNFTSYMSTLYNSDNNKIYVFCTNSDSKGNLYSNSTVGNINNDTILFDKTEIFTDSYGIGDISTVYDSVDKKIVVVYHNDNNGYGTVTVYSP